MKKELGEILQEMGLLTQAQLGEALSYQRNRGMKLGEALLALKIVPEGPLTKALAKQHGLPFVDVGKGNIGEDIIDRVPAQVAAENGVLPLLERRGKLVLAVDDPLKSFLADNLQFVLGTEVEFALAAPQALKKAMARYYGAEAGIEVEEGGEAAVDSEGGDEEDDAPIIRLVHRMIEDALEKRASDIHVEPFTNHIRVRFRVDGVLREAGTHPAHLHSSLVSRLKIMAGMDIAERRKPQDGRIGLKVKGRDIDIRASILPGNHGETMVLRLLDRDSSLRSLEDLGFQGEDFQWFDKIIKRPNGIILVTGPTGSGKTTTLYAALRALNRPDVKIITAEDPVEYHIKGINQVQVKNQIGLSFARILRAMLRQAPNVILVGEIRDAETAEIAIQAALTGHLVFSTLHTNDAASAVTRLIDMGVKPFLVAASLQAVIAQRLIRTLCEDCRDTYAPPQSELTSIGLDPGEAQNRTFYRERGCPQCTGTGYRGRKGVFERLELDAGLRDLIFTNSPIHKIRDQAQVSGRLTTLQADGLRKVLAGQTSIAEILRVTRLEGSGSDGNGDGSI